MGEIYFAPDVTSGTGTIDKPAALSQFNKFMAAAPAGTEAILNDGEYTQKAALKIGAKGTTDAPIVMRSRSKNGANIVGPPVGSLYGQTPWHGLVLNGRYIVVSDVGLYNAPHNGIHIGGQTGTTLGQSNTVENCRIAHAGKSVLNENHGGQGVLVSGTAHNAAVKGCTIWDCKEHLVYPGMGVVGVEISDNDLSYSGRDRFGQIVTVNGVPVPAAGLQVNGVGGGDGSPGCLNFKILRNRIYQSAGTGLLLMYMSDSRVEGNVIWDNTTRGMHVAIASSRNRIVGNHVVSTKREVLFIEQGGNKGPTVMNEVEGNMLWALGNYPNSPIVLSLTSVIAKSGHNIFRSGGSYVGRVDGQDVTLAQWAGLTGDTTSVEQEPYRMPAEISTYLDTLPVDEVPDDPDDTSGGIVVDEGVVNA